MTTRLVVLGALVAALLFGTVTLAVHAQQSPTSPAPQPQVNVNAVVPGGAVGVPVPGAAPAPAAAGRPAPAPAGPKAPSPLPVPAEPKPGVKVVRPSTPGVRVTDGEFRPVEVKTAEYGAVPDAGETMTVGSLDQLTPVTELLSDVGRATGWNIIVSPQLEQTEVRFFMQNVKAPQVLEVLRFNGIYYTFSPETNTLYVMPMTEHLAREYGDVIQQEFVIRHADVLDIDTILESLMSPQGKSIADPRTGTIMVWDTAANMEEMRKTVARLDVPLEPATFQLKYLDAESMLDSVESMLSSQGVAHVDLRTNTLVVNDLPSRQEQIAKMLETLDRRLDTRTWTLNYIEPKIVLERLENLVPEEMGAVTMDETTHQVSVTAIPERLDEIAELIADWDVKGRQVQIEAYVVAARSSIARDLGINWSYFDERDGTSFAIQSGNQTPDYFNPPAEGQRLTVGSLPYQVPLWDFWRSGPIRALPDEDGDGLPDIIVPDPEFKGNRVSLVLDYLDSSGELNVLARPRVTVHDGQEAVFENTEERPYQTTGYYGDVVTSSSANRVIPLRVEFVTVGTILRVKPRISEDDNVRMTIEAEDSSAENVQVQTGSLVSTIPQKSQNRAQTDVIVHDSQTLVIGGLRFTSLQDDVERVPFLGELPVVGRLFRTTGKDHRERELLVFITPTIVDEFTMPESVRLAEFDAHVTERIRHSSKSLWGRINNRLRGGANEIDVAVGRDGSIFSEGSYVAHEELAAALAEVEKPAAVTVIIRADAASPQAVVTMVAETAMELGFKVDFDDKRPPAVPSPSANEAVPLEPLMPAAPPLVPAAP